MKKLIPALFLAVAVLGAADHFVVMDELGRDEISVEQIGLFDLSMKHSCEDYQDAVRDCCNTLCAGLPMEIVDLRLDLALERMEIQRRRCDVFYSGPVWKQNKRLIEDWKRGLAQSLERCRKSQLVLVSK